MNSPRTNITLGKWSFDYCAGVEISQSIDTLTDTCRITVPRKFQWEGKQVALGDDPLISYGDRVIVSLGYDDDIQEEFRGYVREISSGVPVEIQAEDSMFLLKKDSITRNYAKVSLRTLLSDILPEGITFVVPEGNQEISLGQFRISKASIAKVLDELKNTYGLYSYFRNLRSAGAIQPTLYCGLAFWTDNRTEHVFRFKENIIKDELQYRRQDDIRLKIKATSMLPNNKKIEVEVGDDDGETRSVFQYNVTQAELRVFAEKMLDELKYTGYYGSFTAFGFPSVQKGDIARIEGDDYHPDGSYLIRSVRKTSGTSGYRQIIELDQVLNED